MLLMMTTEGLLGVTLTVGKDTAQESTGLFSVAKRDKKMVTSDSDWLSYLWSISLYKAHKAKSLKNGTGKLKEISGKNYFHLVKYFHFHRKFRKKNC